MWETPKEAGGQGKSGPSASDSMLVVLCTFPDVGKARVVAKEIVSEGLAACVNLLPNVESIYRWKGEVRQDAEILAIFKVASKGFEELENALNEKHPYDTPEIVGIPADRVNRSYLAWVLNGQ